MVKPTISQAINTQIDTKINQIPQPEIITIIKTYNGNYADIKFNNNDTLEYIPCIGTPTLNEKAILLPLKNNELIIITR